MEIKRELRQKKSLRKLNFKMFNNHGHFKLINEKKEVFSQILIAKTQCFK